MRHVLLKLGVVASLLFGGAVGSLSARELSPQEALSRAKDELRTTPSRPGAHTLAVPGVTSPTASLTCVHTGQASVKNRRQPAYYIFNAAGGNGWVIASADDRLRPVLGMSDNGSIDMANIPPAMKWWLGEYTREIEAFLASPSAATAPAYSPLLSRSASDRHDIEPLVTTKWNQGEPYNLRCPIDQTTNQRSLTGCVATAFAQVVNYHREIVSPRGQHSYNDQYGVRTYDFGNAHFDWDNMRDVYGYKYDSSANEYVQDYTDTEADAVAELMYACGVAVNMIYWSAGSPANTMLIQDRATTYFGFGDNVAYDRTALTNEQWESIIYSALDAKRPVIYSGSGSGGHCFVCDGYKDGGLFHFNWGWGGGWDDYFALTALNPGGDNFNLFQSAIVLLPPGEAFDLPEEVAGRDVATESLTYAINPANKALALNAIPTNVSGRDITFNLHKVIIDESGNYVVNRNLESGISLTPTLFYTIQSTDFPTTSLSDGTYYAAYEYEVTSPYRSARSLLGSADGKFAVKFTVAGGNLSVAGLAHLPNDPDQIEPIGLPRLSLTALTTVSGKLTPGQENTVSGTVTNIGEGDFYGPLHIGIKNQYGNVLTAQFDLNDGNNVSISKGGTLNFEATTELPNIPSSYYILSLYGEDVLNPIDNYNNYPVAIMGDEQDVVAITGLNFEKDNITVKSGGDYYVRLNISPAEVSSAMVILESDRDDVTATLNGYGNFVAINVMAGAKPGKATIKAKSIIDPSITATLEVTIPSEPHFEINYINDIVISNNTVGVVGLTNVGNASFEGNILIAGYPVKEDGNLDYEHRIEISTVNNVVYNVGENRDLEFPIDFSGYEDKSRLCGQYRLLVHFIGSNDSSYESIWSQSQTSISEAVPEPELIFAGIEPKELKIGEVNKVTATVTNRGNADFTDGRLSLRVSSDFGEARYSGTGTDNFALNAGQSAVCEFVLDLTEQEPTAWGKTANVAILSSESPLFTADGATEIPVAVVKPEPVFAAISPRELVIGEVNKVKVKLENRGVANFKTPQLELLIMASDAESDPAREPVFAMNFTDFELGANQSKEIEVDVNLADAATELSEGQAYANIKRTNSDKTATYVVPTVDGEASGRFDMTLVKKSRLSFTGVTPSTLIVGQTNTVKVKVANTGLADYNGKLKAEFVQNPGDGEKVVGSVEKECTIAAGTTDGEIELTADFSDPGEDFDYEASSFARLSTVDGDGNTAPVPYAGNEKGHPVTFTAKPPVKVSAITVSAESNNLTVAAYSVEAATMTLTATVTPDDATNKSVVWSISGEAPEGVSIDPSSGVLSASRNAADGTKVIVIATANDGSEIASEGFEVTVSVAAEAALSLVEIIKPEYVVIGRDNALQFKVSNNGTVPFSGRIVVSIGQGVTLEFNDVTIGAGAETTLEKTETFALIAKGNHNVTVAGYPASNPEYALEASGATTLAVTDIWPVSSIELNADNTQLRAGETATVNITVAPAEASNRKVTLASSDPESLTVTENEDGTATVTVAERPTLGTVTVTATATDGSQVEGRISFEILATPVTAIEVSAGEGEAALTLKAAKQSATLALKATITPANATVHDVVWSVEPAYAGASVDEEGVLTVTRPAASGEVAVRATSKEEGSTVFGEIKVALTVEEPVASIALAVAPAKVKAGETAKATATVAGADGKEPTNKAVAFAITRNGDADAEEIDATVTIDGDGNITVGDAPVLGLYTVTATAADGAGATATATFEIVATPVVSVTVAPAEGADNELTLAGNMTTASLQFTAVVAPDKATVKAVEWTIKGEHPANVTIDEKGLLTAVRPIDTNLDGYTFSVVAVSKGTDAGGNRVESKAVEVTLVVEELTDVTVSGLVFRHIDDKSVAVVGYTADYKGAAIPANVDMNGTACAVTAIGDEAFKDCAALRTLTLPASVTAIGNSSFAGCSGLRMIYVRSTTPAAITGKAFDDAAYTAATLRVPDGHVSVYRAAGEWGRFNLITNTTPVVVGIDEVDADNLGAAEVYDLSGRRVKNPVSGFYIVNGRKVFIRR